MNYYRAVVNSFLICTCTGLTTGVALLADVIELIEAVWAMLNTQLGALQLQKRRWTGPTGLRPWPCTQLTGLITFLTVGALFVIPEEMHGLIITNKSDTYVDFFDLQTSFRSYV